MMSVLQSPDTVTVWTENGRPARLVWREHRYVVTDTPTPLRGRADSEWLTHPLEPVVGWRFQGTDDAGRSLIFDVLGAQRQEWRLVAVYE
jgi:hypothetical protein